MCRIQGKCKDGSLYYSRIELNSLAQHISGIGGRNVDSSVALLNLLQLLKSINAHTRIVEVDQVTTVAKKVADILMRDFV